MIHLIKQNFRPFLKMCMVGSIGLFVQLLSFNILRFIFSPVWSVSISIILATTVNFYAHGHITFTQGGTLWSKRGRLFFMYSLVMLFLQGQWLRLGIYCFGSRPVVENLTILSGICWGVILNFLFYKYYIWAGRDVVKGLR
jgi:dolichol-phosphate mannosyltransferase